MSNRTIIYARVSSEDQVEKYGLPLQLRFCRDYAASHELSVVEEISDDGYSGMTLDRPGLDLLRRKIAAGEADAVLMYDVDRLSRDLHDLLGVKKEIEKKVRVAFVGGNFEQSNNGRLFFSIKGAISQYEREQLLERMMRGKKERAKAGLIVGGRTAYGYRYQEGKLIPDESQAPTVREIFSLHDSGVSIRAIARRLREAGISPSRGHCWGHSSIRRILANETYAGVAYYGTLKRAGSFLEVRQPVDRVTLGVPALISREQWERVQNRLTEAPACGKPSNKYLLRGLLYCHCGRRMHGNCRRNHLSYRCGGRDKDALRLVGTEPCRAAILASKVDTAVWQSIATTFSDEEIVRAVISRRQKELQTGANAAGDTTRLRDQLAKLRRREKTALAAVLDPDLEEGRTAIKLEYRKIQQEAGRVEWEIATMERASRAANDATAWLDTAVSAIRQYLPLVENGAPEKRQEFVRRLVPRVEWNGIGELRINCVLGSELSITSTRCAQYATSAGLQPEPFQITLIARVA